MDRSSASRCIDGNSQSGSGLWVGLLLALLVSCAVLLVYWVTRRPQTIGSGLDPGGRSNATERVAEDIPDVRFTDTTETAGIRFEHWNGAAGEKLLPETMGGGVAFLDYDNDGDQDLFLVNSTDWPWHRASESKPVTSALYRNDGSGTFEDVTMAAGLAASLYGMGVAVGDYDNDGWVDLYVTGVGGNLLFHNSGQGHFENVTTGSGVGGATNGWSTSAAFLDMDRDGDLDLFVCNYVEWSRAMDLKVDYQLPGIGRAYGPPFQFPGSFPCLYRNDGVGRFTDISSLSGIQVRNQATGLPLAKSLGVAPVDIDNDGWIDLVVANDTVQNFVFQNQRNGTFKEIGARSGVAFDSYGQPRGAMGIDAARFRNDQALGIAIGNFANEMNALYVSQRDALQFADEAVTEGVGPASQALLKFGLFFFDFDLDGHLDVLTANGHLEPEIARVHPGQQYRQSAQLFWNRAGRPGARFIAVPERQCGPDLMAPMVGRGSAFADVDGDGDLDVILTQINGRARLLRNDQRLGHRWIRMKLVGQRCNRDAIGSWIRVRLGGQTLSRQVMPTRGYLSQSELPVTFGLGNAERLDHVEIAWADGSVQRLDSVPLGQTVRVVQSK